VAWIDRQILVKLRLPSGREIEMASKGTWIGVETEKMSEYAYSYAEGGDPINHVSVLPLLEAACHKLASQLDRIAANLAHKRSQFQTRTDDPQAQADNTSECPDFAFHTEMKKTSP
jgi:hypothetical protein